jgi:isocitrate dehydrogenase kinase/phosphatase
VERFGDLPAIAPAPAAPPAANTTARAMLFRNVGVTRLGRVVFYDYDAIQTMTEMNFRRIPPAPHEEAERSTEPWHPVCANDVIPEEFARFLLGDPRVRLDDIFPYDTTRRFARTVRGAGPASFP